MNGEAKVGRNLLLGLIAFGVALFIFFHYYTNIKASLAIFWLFGLAYGIVIQRSKFCFASAFRDLFLFKRGELMKAIIVGLIVATMHIEDSINIPIHELPNRTNDLPAELGHPIISICLSGARSAYATMFLKVFGYSDSKNLDFGMSGWMNKGFLVVKGG